MIRILGKNEAAAEHPSELVGRFVGKEGMMNFRGYTRPMIVTGYSGTRLYARCSLVDNKHDDGAPKLRPVEEWDEEVHIQLKSVAYVCDTAEEGEQMMLASRRAMQIWQEGQKRIQSETDAVFTGLLESQPTAKDTGIRTP